jgi:hypothetical protein
MPKEYKTNAISWNTNSFILNDVVFNENILIDESINFTFNNCTVFSKIEE